MRVAFFDFDHTLLMGDSNALWFDYLLRHEQIRLEDWQTHEAFMEDYRQGRLDFAALQAFRIAIDRRLPPALLHAHRATFIATEILPALSPVIRERVRSHLAGGDEVVIVSATRHGLISQAAEALGIRHLVTSGEQDDPACYGSGKVVHAERWLAGLGQSLATLEHSWFYSDSRNDLPLMEQVRTPVAVEPDPVLLTTARDRHWEIIPALDPVTTRMPTGHGANHDFVITSVPPHGMVRRDDEWS